MATRAPFSIAKTGLACWTAGSASLARPRCDGDLCDACRMITEQAVLDVKPGQEPDFERDFGEARLLIASMPGFESLQLHRCIERSNRYLLLVVWQSLEDHLEGFRGSPKYEEWRRLLHHYYDPFPTVEHFGLVARA
jgi:heme-degrading monooxygenase HmoA